MTTTQAVTLRADRIGDTRVGGVKEIADELGVPRTNVSTWIDRRDVNGFPAPLVQLAMGGVYDLDDALAWASAHGIAGGAR